MTIGIMATMSAPIADAYFLGQLGTRELAAISFTFPVVLTLMSLSIGLGAGTASVVSRAIGRVKTGDIEESDVRRVSTDAVVLSGIVVTVVAILGWFLSRPVFALLGAEGETLDMVTAYMKIWFIGLPPLGLMMVASNLLRSNGDAKSVSLVMILSAVVNVALDPLFIFGWGAVPALGVEGAAWATVVARFGAIGVAAWLVVVRDRLVSTSIGRVSKMLRSWGEIARIALPSAFGNAVNPLGITAVTALLATYGEATVAGFGTATRIETFACIPMLALSAAIGPVAGQNFGAGERERVRCAHRDAYVFDAAWSLAMAVALWFSARALAGLFTSDEEVIGIIVTYLRIVPITLAGYGLVVVCAGGLNAIGEPWLGLAVYALRTVLLYVPLAWLAAQFGPVEWVFWGIAAANAVTAVAVAWWSLRYFAKLECGGESSAKPAAGTPANRTAAAHP